jgi:hypothetical protein
MSYTVDISLSRPTITVDTTNSNVTVSSTTTNVELVTNAAFYEISVPGATGARGATGAQGLTGATGPQGSSGPSGASGLTGATGSQGPAGVSIMMRGTVANVANLPSSNNTVNDAYIVTADGDLYVWGGSSWNSVGQIIGPEGATGAQGSSGPTGATGPTGSQGNIGATGASGQGFNVRQADWTNGGSYQTYDVVRYNNITYICVGDPTGVTPGTNEAVWRFVSGPGATGAQGNVGATGAAGASGSQGNVGATGAQGASGSQGATGPTGSAGATGAQGNAGATGIGYRLTSTSSVSLGTGTKTYTVNLTNTNSMYVSGMTVSMGAFTGGFATGVGFNYGTITSYSGTTLVIDCVYSEGSGTYTEHSLVLLGAQGSQGIQGATGPTGSQGNVGATGAAGTNGAFGSTGATGPQGATGVGTKGDTGNTGAQGSTGATGIQGATGPAGATGSQGASGLSLTYKGSWNYLIGYAVNDIVYKSAGTGAGNNYICIQTHTNNPTQDPATATAYWTQFITPQGATGPQGNTGATGPSGATGAAGSNGNIGATGAQGASGSQGPAGATGASGPGADQSVNTTSNVTFASVDLGGVVNSSKLITEIAGSAQVELDTWNTSNYKSAKYLVQTIDSSKIQVEEIVLVIGGNGNINISRYGQIVTTGSAGTFSADIVGSNARLLFTPPLGGAEAMSIRIYKILMAVSA